MKKIKSYRTVGILALIAIIALIAIANTYSRYTTSAGGTDSARVAHWNVNTTNYVKDLFASSYTKVAEGTEQEGIIAPGTSGSFSFSIDGSVETAYTLNVRASGEDNVNGAVAGYNPIKYSLTEPNTAEDKASNPTVTKSNLTFEQLLAAINDIDNGNEHPAGKIESKVYTIGWSWEINGNDEKDTELGNLVSAPDSDKKISLSVSIAATQAN